MKDDIEKKYANAEERGKPQLLMNGLKPTTLGFSPADMHFQELLTVMGKRICIGFGIPTPYLYDDASTLNNKDQATQELYRDKVIPLLSRTLDWISDFLEPTFGNVRVRIKEDSVQALTGQRAKKITSIIELTGAGILSPAQAAEELGFEFDESEIVAENERLVNELANSNSINNNPNNQEQEQPKPKEK